MVSAFGLDAAEDMDHLDAAEAAEGGASLSSTEPAGVALVDRRHGGRFPRRAAARLGFPCWRCGCVCLWRLLSDQAATVRASPGALQRAWGSHGGDVVGMAPAAEHAQAAPPSGLQLAWGSGDAVGPAVLGEALTPVFSPQAEMAEQAEDYDLAALEGDVAALEALSAGGRASAAAAAAAPEVPPPPAPVAPVRRLQCPLCRPFSTTGEVRMLLTHVSVTHRGEVIGEGACAGFAALGRGICTADACGALRPLDAPRCRKRKRHVPARALRAGDVVPGAPGRVDGPAAPAVDTGEFAGPAPAPMPVAHDLPGNFLDRARRRSPQTMLHVPKQFREQLCEATAACIEGCNFFVLQGFSWIVHNFRQVF